MEASNDGEMVREYHQGPNLKISRVDGTDYFVQRIRGRVENRVLYCPSEYISSRHAQIIRKNRAYWIKDIGSSNGTFLNGTKLDHHIERELRFGDIVGFGVSHLNSDPLITITESVWFIYKFRRLEAATEVVDLDDDDDDVAVQAPQPPPPNSGRRSPSLLGNVPNRREFDFANSPAQPHSEEPEEKEDERQHSPSLLEDNFVYELPIFSNQSTDMDTGSIEVNKIISVLEQQANSKILPSAAERTNPSSKCLRVCPSPPTISKPNDPQPSLYSPTKIQKLVNHPKPSSSSITRKVLKNNVATPSPTRKSKSRSPERINTLSSEPDYALHYKGFAHLQKRFRIEPTIPTSPAARSADSGVGSGGMEEEEAIPCPENILQRINSHQLQHSNNKRHRSPSPPIQPPSDSDDSYYENYEDAEVIDHNSSTISQPEDTSTPQCERRPVETEVRRTIEPCSASALQAPKSSSPVKKSTDSAIETGASNNSVPSSSRTVTNSANLNRNRLPSFSSSPNSNKNQSNRTGTVQLIDNAPLPRHVRIAQNKTAAFTVVPVQRPVKKVTPAVINKCTAKPLPRQLSREDKKRERDAKLKELAEKEKANKIDEPKLRRPNTVKIKYTKKNRNQLTFESIAGKDFMDTESVVGDGWR